MRSKAKTLACPAVRQASGGHGGRAERHPVGVGAFRSAGLAGLHLHPPDGPDAATQRGETPLPQHRARRPGRNICGEVSLSVRVSVRVSVCDA